MNQNSEKDANQSLEEWISHVNTIQSLAAGTAWAD